MAVRDGLTRPMGAVLLLVGVMGGLVVFTGRVPETTRPIPVTQAELPVTFSGTADHNTAPFRLNGGTYDVTWSASSLYNQDCYHAAHLDAITTGERQSITGRLIPPGSAGASDHTILYGVSAGQHYVEVISGCSWSLTIKPV